MYTLSLSILLAIGCQAQEAQHPMLTALKERVDGNTYPNIEAILVEKGDNLIIEEYFDGFNRNKRHDTRSAFKSITSLLTGIAIDQGLFSLDDSMDRFYYELEGQEKGKITVQNLLEMRSGLNCEEFYGIGPECEGEMWETDDWIAFCLNVEVKSKPGLNWSYSSNDPMIMGDYVSRASGMTIMDFAKQHLFEPLEIHDYEWTLSPKGRGMTAGSFYMRPLDMLKIARLVAYEGSWGGKQIVSAEWIKKSTDCEIPIDMSFTRYSRISDAKYESARYGFYWYRENLEYSDIQTEILFASGNGGQYMMILPDYNVQAVFTGSNYGNWRGKLPFEIMLKYIIPIIDSLE